MLTAEKNQFSLEIRVPVRPLTGRVPLVQLNLGQLCGLPHLQSAVLVSDGQHMLANSSLGEVRPDGSLLKPVEVGTGWW